MATVSILYPKGADFNIEYYLQKHMPLVQAKWGAAGLESWEVIQYEGDAEYQIQATLVWKSREEFDKAISGPAGAEIFGDVPNFTTAKPILLKGLHKGKVSI